MNLVDETFSIARLYDRDALISNLRILQKSTKVSCPSENLSVDQRKMFTTIEHEARTYIYTFTCSEIDRFSEERRERERKKRKRPVQAVHTYESPIT